VSVTVELIFRVNICPTTEPTLLTRQSFARHVKSSNAPYGRPISRLACLKEGGICVRRPHRAGAGCWDREVHQAFSSLLAYECPGLRAEGWFSPPQLAGTAIQSHRAKLNSVTPGALGWGRGPSGLLPGKHHLGRCDHRPRSSCCTSQRLNVGGIKCSYFLPSCLLTYYCILIV
jgi:hypothetical protein